MRLLSNRSFVRSAGPLLLLFLVPVLVVSARPGPATAADGDRLVYSETGYARLDPATLTRANDERLVLAMFDGLTALDGRTGKVVPAAATRWEEAPDGLSWTFHLLPQAVWSDGSPVKASDFVAAWQRLLDPYEDSPWTSALRPLRGCARVADGDRAMRALNATAKGIKNLLAEHGERIPGKDLRELIERTGVRSFASAIDDAAVKKMLRWGTDPFPKDKAEAARAALKSARKERKAEVYDLFDAFGKDVGVRADGDHRLVVLLEEPCRYLPELVARGPFVPLHPQTVKRTQRGFDPSELKVNGAYVLHGRGSKPRPGVEDPDSVVHLKKNERYKGPRPGHTKEILCYTGQGPEEDLRRLERGELQWLPNPVRDLAARTQKVPGFLTRASGSVVVLRFRADRPPFDSADVRRAFAMLLDRKRLAKALWPAPELTTSLLPDGTAGTSPRGAAPQGDAKAAKKLLKEAGLSGDDFPWVELHYVDELGLDDLAEELLKQWEKQLGVEMGLRIEGADDARLARRAGAYQVALDVLRPVASDASAWLLPLAASHPDGGLGWGDEGFEALLSMARDPGPLLAGEEARLEGLPEATALRSLVAAAKRSGAKGRETLRLALLGAAEKRLLEAAVIVPLLRPAQASVEKDIQHIGSDPAWRRAGFYGDLRSAQ